MKNPKLTTVYIDTDFKCHTEPAEGLRAFDVYGFDGMCQEYIEGHRYVPIGETYTDKNGIVFMGEMMCPWRPSAELDDVQREYEKQQLADYKAACERMGIVV